MYTLIINEPGLAPAELPLEGESITIGRASDRDIVLGDSSVSRHHACFSMLHRMLYIEDCGSSTGVVVNSDRITEKTRLTSGDIIQLGNAQIQVQCQADTQQTRFFDPDCSQGDIDDSQWPGSDHHHARETSETIYEKGDIHGHHLVQLSDSGFGDSHPIHHGENIIGRARHCTIQVSHRTVSHMHCVIHVDADQTTIRDLNSKNGTLVNQQPVIRDHRLNNGDILKMGDVHYLYLDGSMELNTMVVPDFRKTLAISTRMQYSKTMFKGTLVFLAMLMIIGVTLLRLWAGGENGLERAASSPAIVSPDMPASPFPGGADPSPIVHETASDPSLNETETAGSSSVISFHAPNSMPGSKQQSEQSGDETPHETTPDPTARPNGDHLMARALDLYAKGQAGQALKCLKIITSNRATANGRLTRQAANLAKQITQVLRLFETAETHCKNRQMAKAFKLWEQILVLDKDIAGKTQTWYAQRIAVRMAEEFSHRAENAFAKGDYAAAITHCNVALAAVPDFEMAIRIKTKAIEKLKS